jgi:DNA polymerase-3 subunit delta'
VSFSSVGNKYNIVCIWHPEMMMPAAANKLLKTLEEPPPQTLFILVTNKPDELLATIISRVQQISIPDFSQKEIIDFLIDKHSIEPAKAREIAEISNGNLNQSLHILFHFDEYSELLNDFKEFAKLSIKYDYDGIDKWIKKYESAGREALKRFLEYALDILHHSLLQNYQLHHLIKTSLPEKDFISKFYPYAHDENIPKLYELFNEAYHNVVRNANIRILLNTLFLRCNELLKKKNTLSNV